VVLIRNIWELNWHASVDGRAVPLLHADSIDQGVAVPAGKHAIILTYHDPSIGDGLAGSAAALAALFVAAALLRRRERVGSRRQARDELRPAALSLDRPD
jgi:hypothetical protein